MRRVIAWVLVGVALIASDGISQATKATARTQDSGAIADAALDVRAAAVSSTLRCPVCQGESIQDSPAELAQQMRALVREQLREGKTPDEVKAYFVGRYGEWILLEPAMTGLNVALYAFPILVAIGGLFFVTFLVRKWSASQPKADDGNA